MINIKEKYFYTKRATYLGNFKILIEFENDEIKILDLLNWKNKKLGDFEELKNEDIFKQFFLEDGILTWKNGFDLSPEFVYESSKPVVLKEGKREFKLFEMK